MKKHLSLKHLEVCYGGVKALDGVNIHIDEGEVVVLVGPNGAGKSTVLKSIFGLAPITKGDIYWNEKKLSPISFEVAKSGISFVPQGRRVFTSLSVLENLEIGCFEIKNKKEIKKRAEEAMCLFPILKQKINLPAGNLSGGEQQMLAIARGLMMKPKILLLDEPSLGLSPKMVIDVFNKIKEINSRHKTTIVVVEHNIRSIFEIADRAYVLDKGRVVAEDTPKKILGSNILERVFVGKI